MRGWTIYTQNMRRKEDNPRLEVCIMGQCVDKKGGMWKRTPFRGGLSNTSVKLAYRMSAGCLHCSHHNTIWIMATNA